MKITGNTLDDVLHTVFTELLKAVVVSPTKGACREETGVLIEITSPRARLSRTETRGKPFSALGEFLWYMSGSNSLEFIQHYIDGYGMYSDDGYTVRGGYGPKLINQRGCNQLMNIIRLLQERPNSRRAVIQLFDAEDVIEHYADTPCTCTLQFLVREKRLHLIVTMRSNDAYIGLPHDVFCFTMLQELIARKLGYDLGSYRHFAGSLHLYEKNAEAASQYLREGVQRRVAMPKMASGDPWPSLSKVLEAEEDIRNRREPDPSVWQLDPYWADLVRLLQVFSASGDAAKIDEIKQEIVFTKYLPYIEKRKNTRRRPHRKPHPQQLRLF